MVIPKIVGIEQEYALSVRGVEGFSPFQASCFLINSFANSKGLRAPGVRIMWDYGHETPYQDIRGKLFSKSGGQEIVAEEDNLRINLPLPNGARLYTDHAHPEYSTPECLSATDLVACDKAGELILCEAIRSSQQTLPGTEFTLFKNNVDHQGHSYGTHENYLMDAHSHEEYLVKNPQKALSSLIPFLITRQIFAGAGKVGGERPEINGSPYQISQRADFVEAVFGLETMYARPIVNTRQEHHADEKRFRRVHLIIGDANMCEFAAVLKIGTTQMCLQLMEDDFLDEDLSLEDPVKAVKQVSSHVFRRIALADGRELPAIDIQRKFLEKAHEYERVKGFSNVPAADWILELWEYVLRGLEALRLSADLRIEEDPLQLTRRLDWLLKLWLLNRYREGKGNGWDLPNLRVLDLHYHNISPDHGIFFRLLSEGLVERLVSEEHISRFVKEAPRDTRAHFRGKCIERFPREVYLVNWEVVGFNHGEVNRLVPLLNPLDGTSRQMRRLFDKCVDSKELINAIQVSAGE